MLTPFPCHVNLQTNAEVLCFTMASPNHEVAFVLTAGYTAISTLTAGMVVPRPSMSLGGKVLNYLSLLKWPYQAMLLLFFSQNPRTTQLGTPVEKWLELLELDNPSTVGANLAIATIFYFIFIVGGLLCLKYLYKERR